ncbi:hypothetical protein KM043_008362 [Ampulex compressa]|nr:hypothetical protein KM043_008362 [Ampulex compressa]
MVQRATCSTAPSASPNGARISGHEGGSQTVVGIAEDSTTSLSRANPRFSLFKWFKRAGNRESTVEKRRKTHRKLDGAAEPGAGRCSVSSSVESVDTFYSTTTVRSFAFHTAGTLGRCNGLSLDVLRQAAEVGPFAAGASKVVVGNKENHEVVSTLPASAYSRRRDITARYSLQPTATFNSCGNLPERRLSGSLRRLEERGRPSCNGAVLRKVHVKGKRRAPNPPGATASRIAEVDARDTPRSSNRRKRRAPKPPEKLEERVREEREEARANGGMELGARKEHVESQSISNDTLVLQGGVLLSKREAKRDARKDIGVGGATAEELFPQDSPVQASGIGTLNTAMPRPWYKRSVFEHSRDSGPPRRGDILRGPTASPIEIKEECAGTNIAPSAGYAVDASLSRLSFFHRGERQAEERKRDAKRKSGLSILTNISELDKEAAAIVQEEQARARASMLLKSSRLVDAFEKRNDVNEELVQDIVTSAMENSSPRRGTRALISKFNAISNITKVTVNANFFARNAREQQSARLEREAARSSRFEQANDWRESSRFSVQQSATRSSQYEKDISKYFLPQQKAPKSKVETAEAEAKSRGNKVTSVKEQSEKLAAETSSRISFLQSQLAANRINDPATSKKNATEVQTREKSSAAQDLGQSRKEQDSGSRQSENAGRHSLFQQRIPIEHAENTSANSKENKRIAGERLEGVQKEFSNIFDEIDKQLRAKDFRFGDRAAEGATARDKILAEEAGASSRVAKVLDILVEAEKDGKTRASARAEGSALIEDTSSPGDAGVKTKPARGKSSLLSTVEDPVTADLKEMLKEMKHSLPKRGKSKRYAPLESGIAEKLTAEKDTPAAPAKAAYFISSVTNVENIALQADYEADKQKVSSSAQTSGNLRRLSQASTSAQQPSTSGWRQENVLYKTSGKGATGSALVKNTFQLIRPRDFAEIEAMKTTKGPYKENTYANVIEQSLYANAHVPPLSPLAKHRAESAHVKGTPKSGNAKIPSEVAAPNELPPETSDGTAASTEEEIYASKRNMNTLAINRLLRKLEAAIASGHHQQAAGLAKELACLKIHCSVIRQRSARLKDQLINVNMYIEDKLAHQGPIPLRLPTKMTIAELKTKVHTEFEIPTNVQRWIIGKNLAEKDETTLDELQAVDGSSVFLYLVAPELRAERIPQIAETQPEEAQKTSDCEAAGPTEELETIEENQETIEANQEEQEEEHTTEELKMERYEELISLENCDVIPNSEPIECPVCFVTYGPREGVILRDCLHMFCRPCLANTVLYCEEAEVKCPYRNTEYTCESTLQEREIKALVEPEIYQQHLDKSIAQAENNAGNNAFHCKTPDCPGWCIYDDDVNNFLCPVCGANNCLTCQVIHAGKNCKQYQQELRLSKETDQESRRTAEMLEEMVDRGEALACPTCAVVLMKKWGCDWLRCSMCKTEICWVTRGPRWGPGGKGDTSGGCRCGENGVKCHPRCNYCH